MNNGLQAVYAMSPGANLEAYISTVNAILNARRRERSGRAFHYQEDLEAARRLVMSHMRFVVHIARSYWLRSEPGRPDSGRQRRPDEGGKPFNPEVGVRLVSFAGTGSKQIHEFILRNWRIVKVATTKAQRKLFFNLRSQKKKLGWLSQDEATAIAEDLGVETKTVFEMEGRLNAHDAAFDAGADDDDESAYKAPAYYLEDHSQDPAQLVEADNYEQDANGRLADAMADLDNRSRTILQQRWLSERKQRFTSWLICTKYLLSAFAS